MCGCPTNETRGIHAGLDTLYQTYSLHNNIGYFNIPLGGWYNTTGIFLFVGLQTGTVLKTNQTEQENDIRTVTIAIVYGREWYNGGEKKNDIDRIGRRGKCMLESLFQPGSSYQ
jgi:hypothetical protein